MSDRTLLILIPARGGSKGFPGKNLAILAGIPLVGRIARVARQAAAELNVRARVVCSTDSGDIADAARTWGAEVPFIRPASLAADDTSSMDVVLHAITTIGEEFDTVVLLQPTSPLTASEDVAGAVRLHWQTGRPVVSVCEEPHPPEWLFRVDHDRRLSPILGAQPVHQRQASDGAHRLNGAIYVASAETLVSVGTFFTPATVAYSMPSERSIDIDVQLDLEIAATVMGQRGARGISIAGTAVGPGQPCFVIAEAGVNHNGSLDLARGLVEAAVEAGADAVKFQTFRAERLATRTAPKAEYQLRSTSCTETQFEMLKRIELSDAAHAALIDQCRKAGILFLSTPFDEQSSDFLDALGVPAFKLPSGELTNVPFLRHVARKGKPLILSTGMGNLKEVADAVDAVRAEGNEELVLLHCVSSYPTDPADANLLVMETLRGAFGTSVGFSDHTPGDTTALAAVALGASVIEKHFTLDKALPGPDHFVSMEPGPLADLVRRIRLVESALGSGKKEPSEREAAVAEVARRSLVASCPIPDGAILERRMVVFLRPGTGMPPTALDSLVGKRANMRIAAGTLLQTDMFS